MIKVFKLNINGKQCCAIATTQFQSEKFISEGGVEIPKDELEPFGNKVYEFSPVTTSFDEYGKIIFTLPLVDEPSPEEILAKKFANLRSIRDSLLTRSYDKAIMSLNRKYELATDEAVKEALKEQIYQWNMYAEALCDLPSQPGAPWDGGGLETPWPEPPAMPVKNI